MNNEKKGEGNREEGKGNREWGVGVLLVILS
jgi:hypothetical protein